MCIIVLVISLLEEITGISNTSDWGNRNAMKTQIFEIKFFSQQCRRVWHLSKCWLMLCVLLMTVAAKIVHITVELCCVQNGNSGCCAWIWYSYCWTAEMKYMRKTAWYIWTDHKTNTEIAKVLNISPVLDKIQEYKRKWKQHVNRMPHNRLPRIIK